MTRKEELVIILEKLYGKLENLIPENKPTASYNLISRLESVVTLSKQIEVYLKEYNSIK